MQGSSRGTHDSGRHGDQLQLTNYGEVVQVSGWYRGEKGETGDGLYVLWCCMVDAYRLPRLGHRWPELLTNQITVALINRIELVAEACKGRGTIR